MTWCAARELTRDRHSCQVPGYTHTHFVDVHHMRPRSEGGRNILPNLITLRWPDR